MAVLPVLREGLEPFTSSVPLPSTLPFLHVTHNPSFFSRRQIPFTVPPHPSFSPAQLQTGRNDLLFPRRLGIEIGV
jgi:hypothetical protein